jgi:hypothetical protein
MKLPMEQAMRLPINLRAWMIDRFVQQKEKENDAMEAAKRKAGSGKKR